MKKIIALLVVFALFAGGLFAVDLGGGVNGQVVFLRGDTVEDSDITASAGLPKVRIEGGGETEDGVFGGWLRMEGDSGITGQGLAWWKPLDMLKFTIGVNPDGHFGKEGITGWMFSQTAYDVAVTNNFENIWSSGLYKTDPTAIGGSYADGWNGSSRNAFFGGWGERALMIEVNPMDILSFNIALPFFRGGKLEDVFNGMMAQVGVNLDFASFALTYTGQGEKKSKIFGYVGLPLGIVGLDVGIGIPIDINDDAAKQQIWGGLGVKAGLSDLFQIRLRAYAGFGGEEDDPFKLTVDLLPYLTLSDTLRVGFTLGFAMLAPSEGDSTIGFNINPYIEVGTEWGPKFLAGIIVQNNGTKIDDKAVTNFAVAIGIQSSF
jgi:hypothetical protein